MEKGVGGVDVMRTHVGVVCSVVGFLGFVVVILGVASEAATAQSLVQNVYETDGVNVKCVSPVQFAYHQAITN